MTDKEIKCVVWDLDNTLWHGVLLENDKLSLRDRVTNIIKTLDSRGILQSIASKNNYDDAMAKLKEFGLSEYFLYPQIHWNSKANSLEEIAKSINIGIDTLAFIDDQAFEREEVHFSHPKVLCIDAENLDNLLALPEMNPRFITEDSSKRRLMYQNDIKRQEIEDRFVGPKEQFLATLNLVFTLSLAREEDLQRAEELTVRTHQLNTTGHTYSYEELNYFRQSDQHILLIAGLDDKYGSYGKIGLALIEGDEFVWTIKLLLMSCRVISKGVGTVMINHIRNEARKNNVRLQAELIHNDRNRMMYMTYKFAHFKEKEKKGDLVILENDLSLVQKSPGYLTIKLL
ncbi:subfamily IIIC HAD-superfamily phosphatase [Thioploca ingrica]|uniref:Subfamily IIIC HAD-superfamily phosphatase n=1 Tax=Thioploca ingrica TaxID=40754 RepID=A0A090AH15_9GAMM|nr:subfamily IIIC HAD-superfamily phosphatase [Thioploca ingrica]